MRVVCVLVCEDACLLSAAQCLLLTRFQAKPECESVGDPSALAITANKKDAQPERRQHSLVTTSPIWHFFYLLSWTVRVCRDPL